MESNQLWGSKIFSHGNSVVDSNKSFRLIVRDNTCTPQNQNRELTLDHTTTSKKNQQLLRRRLKHGTKKNDLLGSASSFRGTLEKAKNEPAKLAFKKTNRNS